VARHDALQRVAQRLPTQLASQPAPPGMRYPGPEPPAAPANQRRCCAKGSAAPSLAAALITGSSVRPALTFTNTGVENV
jgi:hypothetical protein